MTHKAAIRTEIEVTSGDISKILGISADAYIELRYELAFEWLKHLNFSPITARFYILSPTFHIWWEQSVNWRERTIKGKLHLVGDSKLSYYREIIKTIPVYPPINLINVICNEGITAIINDPSLKNVKIY